MSIKVAAPAETETPRLGKVNTLARGALIGAALAAVVGTFAYFGGWLRPDAPDTVRGLGLEFSPPGGELWRTAMINLPVFPFRTPEAFYERLIASKPDPETGKADPAKMKAFLDSHPETVQALKVIKGQPA